MSYHTSALHRRYGKRPRARVPQQALGIDLLDIVVGLSPLGLTGIIGVHAVEAGTDALVDHLTQGKGEECIGYASDKAQPLFDRIVDLHKNWNPTGFFTPDDVRSIVNGTAAVALEANTQLSDAPRSTSDADSTIAQVQSGISRQIAEGNKYLLTASDASFKQIPVDAPGLKDWTLSCLRTALQAVTAGYYFECSMTWLERALAAVKRVLDIVWTAIKGIANLVIKVGEEVAKVPDFLATVVTFVKWGAVGYGIYWALNKLKEHRARGSG